MKIDTTKITTYTCFFSRRLTFNFTLEAFSNKSELLLTNVRKFQSVRATSGFGTKFVQNYMNDKTFEKINIKIVISI